MVDEGAVACRWGRGKGDLLFYLGIYAGIAVLFGIVTLFRSLHFSFGAVRHPPLASTLLALLC